MLHCLKQGSSGEVIITNDGATIMSHMQVFHPTAKMLVELSKAQDVEAGDGTTSVVVLCGSMLDQCAGLLEKGIHPTMITESFQMAAAKAEEVLTSVSVAVDLTQREQLLKAAQTSLASKVRVQRRRFRLIPRVATLSPPHRSSLRAARILLLLRWMQS